MKGKATTTTLKESAIDFQHKAQNLSERKQEKEAVVSSHGPVAQPQRDDNDLPIEKLVTFAYFSFFFLPIFFFSQTLFFPLLVAG